MLIKTIESRIKKNGIRLFFGTWVGFALNITAVLIIAKAYGPTIFGMVATAQSTTLLFDRLLNFQSWQYVAKYGAVAAQMRQGNVLLSVLHNGLCLDILSAVGACLFAQTFAYLQSKHHYINGLNGEYLAIYSWMILFNLVGTPTGYLRAVNKYTHFAIFHTFQGLFRLIATCIAWTWGWNVIMYLVLLTVLDALLPLLLVIFSLLNARELAHSWRTNTNSPKLMGAPPWRETFHFVFVTNVSGSIRLVVREADILVVAHLLGPVAAGTLKIAKYVGSIPLYITDALYNAIYPELSKLWATASTQTFNKLILKGVIAGGILAFTVLIVSILIGYDVKALIFPEGYEDLMSTAIVYMLGGSLGAASFPLAPALLAQNRQHILLFAMAIGTIGYLFALFGFTKYYGVQGAAAAFLIFYITWIPIVAKSVFNRGLYYEHVSKE